MNIKKIFEDYLNQIIIICAESFCFHAHQKKYGVWDLFNILF